MEITDSMTEPQAFYEAVQWVTIICINLIMLMFAYWLADVAVIMQSRTRRMVTFMLAIASAGIGIWRMIAIIVYFDSFTARLAIPFTAALSWFIIGLVGFFSHRYILKVNANFLVKKENVELMEAVQNEIVLPLLRGESVSNALVAEHKAKSLAFSQK